MISVAVCTYNGEKYIAEQLESLLNQTLPPDEIIICDDRSQDKTIEIVRSFADEWDGKIKLTVNPENLGFVKNFEKAISLCTGDIIFLCDQDDVWDLNKIKDITNVFTEQKGTVLIFHDAEVVDEILGIIYKSFWKLMRFDYSHFNKNESKYLSSATFVQGSACAFKKVLFEYARPIPEAAYHDEWLALVAITVGKVVPYPKCLLKYRQSAGNALGVNVSLCIKIKQWFLNSRVKSKQILTELKRRSRVLEIYIQRYLNNDDEKKYSFEEAYEFLKIRINCIKDKNFKLFKYLPLYFTILPFKPTRCMQIFVSDILGVVFGSREE